MQLAANISNHLHQPRFNKRVYVLGHGLHGWAFGAYGFKSGSNLIGFSTSKNACTLQRRAVSDTRPDVDLEQSPIEPKRVIELRKLRIRFSLKPATPKFFLSHIDPDNQPC